MAVVINEFEVLGEPPSPAGEVPAARAPAAPPLAALQPLLEQLEREARQRAERVQEL